MEWGAKRRRTGGNNGTAGGASSTHTSTEDQEVATSSGYDYEVFLSFKGPDTRASFTDFLYTSLNAAGIRTFKDDEDLRIGEEFAPELLQAIKQSKISIPIFSKNYASSVWCLKEVVQMVECKKTQGQIIMPIFYDVAPSEVRYQTGGYKEAFHSHENKKRCDEKTMQDWKDALSTVGAIHGWDLHNKTNRKEGAIAKTVTEKVFNKLRKAYLVVSDNLVSVDDQVGKIMEMVDAHKSETWIVGIYGMGGIGKTTVAKIIYNQLSKDFQHCCFLSNVRETSKLKGIHCLQHQLVSDILNMKNLDIRNSDEGIRTIKYRLSNKKVLLLLDDVEEKDDMNAIVGGRDWFGKGSKIIITTRRKDVLISRVDYTYEVNGMNDHQSLQLFSKHAFKSESPLDEHINQSKRAICIAGGLPLALEVMGSLLSITKKKKWDATLKMLESVPHNDVQKKLKISYDALDDRQKHIFLDIACFFIGYDQDIVVHFWDESKFPEVALEVLQNMSLIKIEDDNKVWMHDQLRDLGREMVHQESEMNIEKQSRVWNPMKALDLLRRREGKTKVEALYLYVDDEWQYCFTYKDFERISNLRFLEVYVWKEYFRAEERLLWRELPSNVLPTNVFQENSDLLPELRWLAWRNIPPTFSIMNFSMKNVVILDLSESRITHDWEGWSHMKAMKNLKVMDLNNCNYLERTPDFLAHSYLERLILQSCDELVEIDESICLLKSLVFLDVRYCSNLQGLLNIIGNLESLKELDIFGTRIKELPDSIGNLEPLIKLDISGSEIKELPDSIGNLKSLIELDISESKIKELPDSIESLESLIKLDISSTGIEELPDSIGKLKNLKVVKMNLSAINKIPNALWTIEKLEEIEAVVIGYFDVEIGNHICRNRSLRILKLNEGGIYRVPRLPDSLTILELSRLYMNTFPDLSSLTNLKELELWFVERDYDGEFEGESDGPMEEDPMPLRIGSLHEESDGESDGPMEKDLPRWIGNLSKLESLVLKSPYMTALPTEISLLPRLKSLSLYPCPNLRCLPSLPSSLISLSLHSGCVTTLPTDMTRLKELSLDCPNLRCLPSPPSTLSKLFLTSKCVTTLPTDMNSLPRLKSLLLSCPNLRCLPSLPSSLSYLGLYDCKSGFFMEDLSNLKTLSCLNIYDCAISEIQGLDRLENLQQLHLTIHNCGNLVEIQGELPPSLYKLKIWECGSLQKLPDLSRLKGLQEVEVKGCGKLNVEAISSLCLEKGVEFKGDETK